ncbi:MAG TPA: hypothetical protein PLW35_12975, partial [Verrucomicrobiota bacterium]|nr:hypothetical protein [Verrucomicrobiota bacterium]
LGIETKRQQAAALQALRAHQRPVRPLPFQSRREAALNGAPVTWGAGRSWYGTGPSALELLVQERQRS